MSGRQETDDVDSGADVRTPADLLPHRLARVAKRVTIVIGVLALAVFVLKFDTRWVPSGMDTVDAVPGGSWVILDSWRSGMRVGSNVLIETPQGLLVSQISGIDGDSVTTQHPNADSVYADSRRFGAIPIEQVQGTILVAFPPAELERLR